VELPELPARAMPVALPLLPEWADDAVPPEPPPPLVEPLWAELASALPVSPDLGLAIAFPPLPVEECETGFDVAEPVSPVLPEEVSDVELALPEAARPALEGFDVDLPVPPVSPVLPEVALPWPSPCPDPPVEDEPLPEPLEPEPLEPEPLEPEPLAGVFEAK